jgi:hypothetical protein
MKKGIFLILALLLFTASPAWAAGVIVYPGQLPSGCTNGQVPTWQTSTNTWVCGTGGGGGTISGNGDMDGP